MVKKLLIVDDDVDITDSLKEEIENFDPQLKVIVCNFGYDALRTVLKGIVDVVLTDIAMPDMDGYELFKRIRDYDSEIPVIMMTGFGYDPNHSMVKAKKDGISKLIYKPFEIEYLMKIIESVSPG